MQHCSHESKLIRALGVVAAGQTVQRSGSVDTLGYQGVEIAVLIGSIDATGTVKVQLEYSDDNANWTAHPSAVDFGAADDNKMAVLDAFPAPGRYVRALVTRGTADSAIEAVVARLYRGIEQPPARDASEKGLVRFVGANALT